MWDSTNVAYRTVISPASPVDSSPLSTPPLLPILKTDEAREDETTDGAYDSVQDHATPAEEDSGQEELTPSFDCPNCDKTYSNVKSLKVPCLLTVSLEGY
jgi:hypothetical protein